MSLAELERPEPPRAHSGTPGLPLRVRGLGKSFGGNQVIQRLDLDVPAGQFLAIVGRSGCGKSTLLRLLAGLEAPDTGSLRIGDASASASPVRLMFQEPRLLPWASIVDNVAVGFGRRKPENARDKAFAALADVGLAARAKEWPSVLSGGQKQRVALARALVSHPPVLAFDEPTSALDPELVGEVLQVIRTLAEEGRTMLIVTHEMGFARDVSSKAIFLHDGRVEEAGPPAQLFGDPVSDRCRRFVTRHLTRAG